MPFPTVDLLDDFNDPAASPPSSNWSLMSFASGDLQGDGSSVVTCETGATFCADYWNVQTFGPDCAVLAGQPAAFNNNEGITVYGRIKDVGTFLDGYSSRHIRVGGSWYNRIYRLDNGVVTQLGSSTFIGSLTDVGLVLRGSQIQGWAGGTMVQASVDATYAAAGYLGLEIIDPTQAGVFVDDFHGGTVVFPQIATPDADVSDGSWTQESGGASLFSSIDEIVADDGDYIQSSVDPTTTDVTEIGLSNVTDPNSSSGHIVRYRYGKSVDGGNRIDLVVRLMQGGTQIASWTHTDIGFGPTDAAQTLTGTQADNITDYTNLRLKFEATKV